MRNDTDSLSLKIFKEVSIFIVERDTEEIIEDILQSMGDTTICLAFKKLKTRKLNTQGI